jgi:hypothetical protein
MVRHLCGVRSAALKGAFRGIPVHRALRRDIPLLSRTASLAEAANVLRSSPQQHALVLHDRTVVGTLSMLELIAALQRSGPGILVEDLM